VGSTSRVAELRAQLKSAGGDVSGRHVRAPWSLPVFAGFVTFAFLAVTVAPPTGSPAAYAFVAPGERGDVQSLAVEGEYAHGAGRDGFTVSEPMVVASPASSGSSAPAAGVPDPGTAQAIAYGMLQSMGMGDDQYNCLVALWNRESHWNVYAYNASSGAYGIPQSLPGDKMASAGADWATNPATQITWGLGYISSRYGTPCGAWAHSEEVGWY
jgi:hypothetical protein